MNELRVGDRTGRKSNCLTCGETVLIVRHPSDAMMSSKELPTSKIRKVAMHISDLPGDFCEVATTYSEINALVSSMVCEKKPKQKPWEVAA